MSKVNLKKLASELSVSISTVSKALKDSHEIGQETKHKVLSKARELGYKPNPYATYMRNLKSKTIAIVIPEMTNNFFLQVINGAESIAREKDYHLLVYITHEDAQKEIDIINHLQNGRVDGILMSLSSTTTDFTHLHECINNKIPIIFFDRICHEIETVKIITDDFASGFAATEHLIQNGCRNIAYLSISKNLSIDNKRMQGYLEALDKHNMKPENRKIVKCSHDPKSNYREIKKLLSGPVKVDGIFASIEELALATYSVCKDLAIKIPQKLKVICFSNLITADFLNPPLTTITQPANEMGIAAASQLFKYLDKKGGEMSNENIIIKSALTVRGSAGA
ncbi:LacI family DNA-binding transcriptional regulator [Ferruginibacter sp. HRS2-29]|uniref:LacI family DNA-binding transcriptional regulator n=1 Tax=Ferruginibacter sp. HRS2-29 TaxID=2487334 RepID=UPI0020CD01EA|nr:LacI family DNA-binding transcriptional regulator [Ferruginibacter sp. HRS2-29]MCP9749401.1 LacI family transcriptional regulator [Ferruginibacter sp. HRS2-29]